MVTPCKSTCISCTSHFLLSWNTPLLIYLLNISCFASSSTTFKKKNLRHVTISNHKFRNSFQTVYTCGRPCVCKYNRTSNAHINININHVTSERRMVIITPSSPSITNDIFTLNKLRYAFIHLWLAVYNKICWLYMWLVSQAQITSHDFTTQRLLQLFRCCPQENVSWVAGIITE